jgi:putative inorganic carbon (HCO3(-)) transporter
LLFNLKRGAWIAVLMEFIIIGCLFSRRLLFGSLAISVFLLSTLAPVRDRIGSIWDHFLIHGGRSSIWQLGVEIVGRFPLGVGPSNAAYMRKLDPTMPASHLHMHNNLLNIAVETGFLGLAAFLWWIITIVALGFVLWRTLRARSDRTAQLSAQMAVFLAIALIGWQAAGLVEYNFGDGEVRLIALFMMGILLGLSRQELQTNSSEGSCAGLH